MNLGRLSGGQRRKHRHEENRVEQDNVHLAPEHNHAMVFLTSELSSIDEHHGVR